MVRDKLLEFVKCTDCLAPLVADGKEALVCLNADCRRRYGVIAESIPNMLLEESSVMDEDAWKTVLENAKAKPAEAGAVAKRSKGRNKSRSYQPEKA